MAQEVKLMGATYSDVPSVLLPDSNNTLHSFVDTSDATATASEILSGYTAYSNGTKVTGTATGGGGSDDFIEARIENSNDLRSYTTIPVDLTAIGDYAFYYCSNLALTSLPENVTSIGQYAFYNCNNLRLTSLPSGVTSILQYAFSGCISLALTSLPDGIITIHPDAFASCSSLALTSLPSGITSIGSNSFYNCTNITLTSLPDRVASIGTYAFRNCTGLALTSLPNNSSLKRLEGYVFYGCTNLALTYLPSGIDYIGPYAFYGCTNLALTFIPSGVTYFNNYTFTNCTSLTKMTLHANITSLGNYTFQGCTGMTEYHMQRTTPPTIRSTTFNNIPSDCKIYVPVGCLSAYQSASYWSNLASHMVEEPSYTTLSGITFDGDSYFITNTVLDGSDTVSFSYEASQGCNVIGSYVSSSSDNNFSLYHSTSAYVRYDGGLYRPSLSNNTVYAIEMTPTGINVDGGTVKSWSKASFTCSTPMWIGMLPNSSAQALTGTIYGNIVVDGKLNAVPSMRDSDGVIGYLDTLTSTFYTNQGTGTVTAVT